MGTLSKKIDFVLFISVKNANPNGDPLLENMPRTDYEGYGEISDVCIKRKIRNRLQDMGHEIFVQSNDRRKDEYKSLQKRLEAEPFGKKSDDIIREKACEKWMDIRSFGQVMAFRTGQSIGIRGAISISFGKSLSPVDVISMQITKSTNGKEADIGKRGSDTMGTKHFVDFGIYQVKGSMNCYFAKKTGFTDDDAEEVRKALLSLFENDMSSARPEGSMDVERLYWFTHPNELGVASSAKIHDLVKINATGDSHTKSFNDYGIKLDEERTASYKKKGLVIDVFEGGIYGEI